VSTVGFEEDSSGKRHELDKKKRVDQRHIRHRTCAPHFISGPDDQAGQPQERSHKNQKPKDSNAGVAAEKILQCKKRRSADQDDLECIANSRQRISLREKQCYAQRNCHNAKAQVKPGAHGMRIVQQVHCWTGREFSLVVHQFA